MCYDIEERRCLFGDTYVAELPAETEQIIRAHLDDWNQILDGVEECFRHIDRSKDAEEVRAARQEMRALRDAGGIYDDQAATLKEVRRRAATLTERVRCRILDGSTGLTFTSHGYRFDVSAGTAMLLSRGGARNHSRSSPHLSLH